MHKEKLEMELKPFEAMCEQAKNHLHSLITGSDSVDPNEILVVAKTLKEITEIKEKITEMCYKKQIIEAMEEDSSKYGYRHMPLEDRYERDYMRDPEMFKSNMRLGYIANAMPSVHEDMRYGQKYNDYNRARKHYTETNDHAHKMEMNNHASEYTKEVKDKIWEMYQEAEPSTKAVIKEEVRQMLGGMN